MQLNGYEPVLNLLQMNRLQREPRIFQTRKNFDYDSDYGQRYRLQPATVDFILNRISDRILLETRQGVLSPRQQLLTLLRFVSSNSLYHYLRDSHGPSESTVCITIKRVVDAINDELFDEVVRWPDNCQNLAEDFYRVGGMPSVCGAVDGTLIPIVAPSVNEHQYVDRHKCGHSLNIMAVCGPLMEFFYVSARWPGSVNDARVLRLSTLAIDFDGGYRPFPGAVILGDLIYPTKDWLIPPLPGNVVGAEKRFNEAQKRTRCTVERAFGLMKTRFRSLDKLRVKSPNYACKIIKCITVLHNLCLQLEPERYRLPEIILPQDEQINAVGRIQNNERRIELDNFFR